jgi:hypothetical protein
VSSPVEVQQLDGMEGAGPDASLPASGPAFHLARLWPMFPAQPCLCGGLVEVEDALPATATDDQGRKVFAGCRHRECVGL